MSIDTIPWQPPMVIRAAVYARYSSDNQRCESIDQQIAVCRKYAAANNIEIVTVYDDRAITGTSDRRPGFQAMIKDSAKHKFDIVLVYAFDRFARDRYDSARYKHALKENGVRVVSATEHIPDDPSGIILESMLEGMAEYYSAELSRKVMRGMEDNASKCMVTGTLPLGYVKGRDKRYQIKESEAETVREAFTRVLAGERIVDIISDFNRRGMTTKTGKPFCKESFDKILHNERYTGVYIWHTTRVEGGIPAIISKEDFDAVQSLLFTKPNARRDSTGQTPQRRRRDTGVYILTGKLFCGHCGEPMVGKSGHSRTGDTHYYYSCRGRLNNTGCKKSNVRKDSIESEIARFLRDTILTDEAIDALAEASIQMHGGGKLSQELEAKKEQLSQARSSIDNIMKAIELGIFTPTTKNRLLELEAQQASLSADVARLEAELKTELTKEDIVSFLQAFRTGDISDKIVQNAIIEAFLVKAFLYDDHIDLIFTVGDKSTSSSTIKLTPETVSDVLNESLPGSHSHNLPPPFTIMRAVKVVDIYFMVRFLYVGK